MTALTSTDRRIIANKLLAHRFEAEEKELKTQEHNLAVSIYRDVYKPAFRERMDALPPSWLPVRNNIEVEFAGQYDQLAFLEDQKFLAKHFHPNRGAFAAYPAKHPFSKEHEDLDAAQSRLRAGKDRVRAIVEATLRRFRNTKPLLIHWPEVAPYLSQLPPNQAGLPALPAVALNKALRLP